MQCLSTWHPAYLCGALVHSPCSCCSQNCYLLNVGMVDMHCLCGADPDPVEDHSAKHKRNQVGLKLLSLRVTLSVKEILHPNSESI